jgi:hypothetical protein
MKPSLPSLFGSLLCLTATTMTLASCGHPSAGGEAASSLQAAAPDLVITSRVLGAPTVSGNVKSVPFSVTVRNAGNARAGRFKVSVDYTTAGRSFGVAFSAPGQNELWYPYVESLAAGATRRIDGRLLFRRDTSGSVSLRAVADSCAGDEFAPDYCRVKESLETNNRSSGVGLNL